MKRPSTWAPAAKVRLLPNWDDAHAWVKRQGFTKPRQPAMTAARQGACMPAGPSVTQVIPGLAVLRSYRPGWLRKDLVAGLILTALLTCPAVP